VPKKGRFKKPLEPGAPSGKWAGLLATLTRQAPTCPQCSVALRRPHQAPWSGCNRVKDNKMPSGRSRLAASPHPYAVESIADLSR